MEKDVRNIALTKAQRLALWRLVGNHIGGDPRGVRGLFSDKPGSIHHQLSKEFDCGDESLGKKLKLVESPIKNALYLDIDPEFADDCEVEKGAFKDAKITIDGKTYRLVPE